MDLEMVPPQQQNQVMQENLIQKPDYFYTTMNKINKVVQQEENNWFKIEAWLWIGLFFLLLKVFSVPKRLHSELINQDYLKVLEVLSGFFFSFIILESVWVRLFGEKFVQKISYLNVILLFVVPIGWVFLMFREFKWLCLVLGANLFMIVIMYNFAIELTNDIIEGVKSIVQKIKSKLSMQRKVEQGKVE